MRWDGPVRESMRRALEFDRAGSLGGPRCEIEYQSGDTFAGSPVILVMKCAERHPLARDDGLACVLVSEQAGDHARQLWRTRHDETVFRAEHSQSIQMRNDDGGSAQDHRFDGHGGFGLDDDEVGAGEDFALAIRHETDRLPRKCMGTYRSDAGHGYGLCY